MAHGGATAVEQPMGRRPRTRVSSVDPESFAARLNRLFETVYPPGRGPYCSRELVRALEDRGLALSAPYLSQLRLGRRGNPSLETMELIAEFFGIRIDYFTGHDESYCRKLEEELNWLDTYRDPEVRSLTTALLRLSPARREKLLAAGL
ncbi:helix-turn-helix domain-containing protein [Mycolicibacterium cosmeticum]|uniref:Helix-turn-helix protein n=1 Tax=Mycolicibacterium cosmeticum TaxID=258533 RepID=W9BA16_MYCCO|nr:helix-turn-helix domain-containing protein [Mycolicibacterium cosmeticum]CDO11471.1 Helix-turn-helix protein [Mycolicibacterium cosmeticum]